MSRRVVCDRCGQTAEAIIQWSRLDLDQTALRFQDREAYDLCPLCTAGALRWIKGKQVADDAPLDDTQPMESLH